MSTNSKALAKKTESGESKRYHEWARMRIAGGVNSNVRLGATPLCFASGSGSKLTDLDGNVYIDYALGMGPNILGHAPPAVLAEVTKTLTLGQLFAGQSALELELATQFCSAVSSAELVRFGLSGSEMVQAAMRVARAYTGREEVIKFEGHYHGWFDNVLINNSGPVDADASIPRAHHLQSAGQSRSASDDIAVLPWNDLGAIESYIAANAGRIAAILTEPVMFNTGGILPREGYLQHLRTLASKYDIVLIFDEVITGFRVGLGGAQEMFGVKPDLSIFAKALGAGFPVAALAGRRDIMELIASGRVNHSGTYNANVVSVSAAIGALRELAANDGAVYRRMYATGRELMNGIAAAARRAAMNLQVSGVPTAFHTCFAAHPIVDYASYTKADRPKLDALLSALLERGVRPTGRGTWFLSTAHTDADVADTIGAMDSALQSIR